MRPVFCAGGLFALFALAAQAADLEVLSLRTPANLSIRPGARAEARIEVRVKAGYHVQANPVLNPFLIPVTLEMKSAAGVTAGVPVYPPAKRMRLAGSEEDLAVYDGRFVIALPLAATAAQVPGELRLPGTLRYQACDQEHCLRPRRIPLQLKLTVRP